jgi:predicted esterase
MKQRIIQTTKTARYFILGEPNEKTENIWFVCHGYGELASNFIKNFKNLDDEKNIIIAPEGLHRFYLKGFYGDVGASWMTKEERESDIKDYIHFLDQVYLLVMQEDFNPDVRKIFFGFSQGTAAVCRWVAFGKSKADSLVLWGGGIPNDIELSVHGQKFNYVKPKIYVGEKDKFITASVLDENETRMKKFSISVDIIKYKGGHKIDPVVLSEVKF